MTELTTARGDWLGEFEWTHASTRTFDGPRSVEAARRELQRHLRDLARRARCKVRWFWVMERTHQGHVHFHALMDAPLTARTVRRSWQRGRAKVEPYEATRGWRHYITKETDDPAVDWDFSLSGKRRNRGRTRTIRL